MQELIDELDFSIKHCHDNERIRIHQLVVIKERAKQYLEKEKEQIIEAVNYGNKQDHYDATEVELSNYYYNETFNQNK